MHPCRHVDAPASPATAPATRSHTRLPNTVVFAMANGELMKKSASSASGEGTVSRHQEIEYEQDDDDQPGPETARLVGELIAEDSEELHVCKSTAITLQVKSYLRQRDCGGARLAQRIAVSSGLYTRSVSMRADSAAGC